MQPRCGGVGKHFQDAYASCSMSNFVSVAVWLKLGAHGGGHKRHPPCRSILCCPHVVVRRIYFESASECVIELAIGFTIMLLALYFVLGRKYFKATISTTAKRAIALATQSISTAMRTLLTIVRQVATCAMTMIPMITSACALLIMVTSTTMHTMKPLGEITAVCACAIMYITKELPCALGVL